MADQNTYNENPTLDEIVFENRMDAQTLLELYIAFNTKVIESILEIANKNFKELTTID